MENVRIAVVGASGLVAREVLRLLGERDEQPGRLLLLGSPRTAGATVEEANLQQRVELLAPGCFTDIDLAIFAAGPEVALEWAPVAADAGAAVVDMSSRFRLDETVPLVVPEVNPDALSGWRERNLVASPSATALGLSMTLAPLAEAVGVDDEPVQDAERAVLPDPGAADRDDLRAIERDEVVGRGLLRPVGPGRAPVVAAPRPLGLGQLVGGSVARRDGRGPGRQPVRRAHQPLPFRAPEPAGRACKP